MELKIQTVMDNSDTLALMTGSTIIYLTASRIGSTITLELSPFEAQTIAEALLKMAAKFQPLQELSGKDDSELDVIESPIHQEKNITEMIVKIWGTQTGGARIETVNGLVILASKDVWDKEGKHLQLESGNGKDSLMYIRKGVEDIHWRLVDCLPF